MLRPALAVALLLAAACGGSERPAPPDVPAVRRPAAGPSTIVFRVPRAGGLVRAYQWPVLDTARWTSTVRVPATARILGFAPTSGRLALQSAKGAVLWLDVRRPAPVVTGPPLTLATFASRGEAVIGLDTTGRLVRVTAEGVTWRAATPGPVRALHPLPDGTLLAVGTGRAGPELWRWAVPDTAISARATLPANAALAPGAVGGRIWVAAPQTVRALVPATLEERLRLDDFPKRNPLALVTTPSGNLMLAAYAETASLEIADRDRGLHAPSWALPGIPRDVRMDPLGRLVLVRPASGESAWAVDLVSGTTRSTISTSWRDDLPTVLPDGTVLVVLGPDVTTLDARTLQRGAVVANGAADWWFAAPWDGFTARGDVPPPPTFDVGDTLPTDPLDSAIAEAAASARASLAPPVDTSGAATAPPRWLVSFASVVDSSRAAALATQLRAGGTAARVVPTPRPDAAPIYRVVVGPFGTRDSAVQAGRAAGREHWVVPAAGVTTAEPPTP